MRIVNPNAGTVKKRVGLWWVEEPATPAPTATLAEKIGGALTKATTKRPPSSALQTLFEHAADCQAEIDRLNAVDGRLSAAALIKASLAMGGSMEEAAKIERAIEGGPEALALREARTGIVNLLLRMPSRAPLKGDRLSGLMARYPAADASLARIGATPRSLYISAIAHTQKHHPHVFGTMEKVGQLEEQLGKATAERDALFAKIKSFPMVIGADLNICGESKEGWVRLGLRRAWRALGIEPARSAQGGVMKRVAS
jgi:hypothetical protein